MLNTSPRPGWFLPEQGTAEWLIRSPETDQEWAAYYELRWRILRAPWQQPHGSERDELEQTAVHRCLLDAQNTIRAIGRLHWLAADSGQIRYMAVAGADQKQGLGSRILQSLEAAARQQGYTSIQLHARESAVPFYRHHGYTLRERSHLLYNEIQHYLMTRNLLNTNSHR